MNIKEMPVEKFDECRSVCSYATNGFEVLSLVITLPLKKDEFRKYISPKFDKKKKQQKKPTKPGKEKAAECFKKLREKTKDFFPWSELVAARIESKKHGMFVMVSYQDCPVDVIEYLISERN